MTIEKTIERLKKLHEKYEAQVQSLTAQRDVINKRLDEALVLSMQTADALASLEGKPKLAEMLSAAMAQEPKTANKIIEELAPPHQPAAQPPLDVPPCPSEAGFKWVKNELNEWVLIPENQVVQVEPLAGGGVIVLPAVENGEFTDNPEDLIQ